MGRRLCASLEMYWHFHHAIEMASSRSTEGDVLTLLCVVRGYHVYKDIWDPYLGDDFTTKYQKNNPHDKYAIAVLPVDAKVAKIVGHLPMEISKECCFVLHGGTIAGEVTGRRRKTIEPCGGMEIPCELTFRHTEKMLEKLKLAIRRKYEHTPR